MEYNGLISSKKRFGAAGREGICLYAGIKASVYADAGEDNFRNLLELCGCASWFPKTDVRIRRDMQVWRRILADAKKGTEQLNTVSVPFLFRHGRSTV